MEDWAKYAFYFLCGVAAFLVIEAILLWLLRRLSYKRKVNARLRIVERSDDQSKVLLELRRARGLASDGRYKLPVIWFNRLLLQSGLGLKPAHLIALMALLAVGFYAAAVLYKLSFLVSGGAGLFGGMVLPLLALRFVRASRRAKFEAQLPDAVDVVVRSLRAGHPLPVAISMVSREMPDPIGSEFGLTADELTYGLDLETAVENLGARVGQDDLTLVVVAISIQSKTGGNLSEILSNLSRVLRARFKMRRRVRALSAEGRFSALALSGLPFLVFAALFILSPNFYGDVWNEPLVKNVLAVAGCVMMIGNLIMYRMVNFKM